MYFQGVKYIMVKLLEIMGKMNSEQYLNGCVTILLGNNQEARETEWKIISSIIKDTRTEKVPDNKYGTLEVID